MDDDLLALEKAPLEEQFRTILEHMNHGVCLFDGQQRMTYCNRKYLDIYGISHDQVVPGMTLRAILEHRIRLGNYPQRDAEAYIAQRMKLVTDQKFVNELHHLRNGAVISISHQPLAGGSWLTMHEDITELYGLRQDINHLAFHDHLTDLPNRLKMNEVLDEAFMMARAGHSDGFALMFLDLDKFKAVNDTHGHSIGDALLKHVAARLKGCVRDSDTVSRLGGDEFAVVATPDMTQKLAQSLARRIIESVREPYEISGHRLQINVSIGVVLSKTGKTWRDEMLSKADKAMYQAKRSGGGDFTLYRRSVDTV